MWDPSFVPDEPNDLSIHLLIRNLRSDCQNKSVSPKNHAHRSRVIRQQIEMFARVEQEAHASAAHDSMDNEGEFQRQADD